MDGDAKQQHGSPMGPANPQALNRYSYVQNNPLKYTDPSGHVGVTIHPDGSTTFHLTHNEARALWEFIQQEFFAVVDWVKDNLAGLLQLGALAVLNRFVDFMVSRGSIIAAILTYFIGSTLIAAGKAAAQVISGILAALTAIGLAMAAVDWLLGSKGFDVTYIPTMGLAGVRIGVPTVERQHGIWLGNKKICDQATIECYVKRGGG
jgi:hypothetical protein